MFGKDQILETAKAWDQC